MMNNDILKSAKKLYILTTGSLFLVGSENTGGLFAYIISSTCSEGGILVVEGGGGLCPSRGTGLLWI